MAVVLSALLVDAHDPGRLVEFWAGVLQREMTETPDGFTLLAGDDVEFPIRFVPGAGVKRGPNHMHLDLTSTSLDDQEDIVDRALGLGGRHLDIGQGTVDHVVLADPDDNEFCVIEPWNEFTAECGSIGALSSDGTQAVGQFWSHALGWPLVWDQDEETAVQSPDGGSKISWGGPPVLPKLGRNRLRVQLSPTIDSDIDREVERLVSLGAVRLGDVEDGLELADPDGNELALVL